MNMNFNQLTLLIFFMWNYAQATTKAIIADESDEIISCDYTQFDSQLENLKKENSLLEQKLENIEKFLDRQRNIFNDLERKVNSLPQQLEEMQKKLIQNNRLNFENLKSFIISEIKTRNPIAYRTDDPIILIHNIKVMLEKYDQILNNIIKNQNNFQVILKEMNLDNHIQTIQNIISDKLARVPKMGEDLMYISNNIVPRRLQAEILNNQNNIKNLLNKIDIERHTQTIKDIISDKLVIIPLMNAKLNDIEGNTISRIDQIQFYHDVEQYSNETDSNTLCRIDENHNLICTIQSYTTNCADLDRTHCTDNKCLIINRIYGPKPFLVSCNDSVDGGGWTVIQRRINGSVDFYRNWSEYKAGFGDINGEFFIGLDKLHALTSTLKPVELLIQLEDFNHTLKYAKYNDFQVGNESENYKLIKVGSYDGTAGDSFSLHVGNNFSTKDRDNDDYDDGNCAVSETGAWWYKACSLSNLNGKYYDDPSELYDAPFGKRGIYWIDFHGDKYSLKYVQMLIRTKKL